MKKRVKVDRTFRLAAALVGALILAAPRADAGAKPGEQRWVPALAAYADALGQRADGGDATAPEPDVVSELVWEPDPVEGAVPGLPVRAVIVPVLLEEETPDGTGRSTEALLVLSPMDGATSQGALGGEDAVGRGLTLVLVPEAGAVASAPVDSRDDLPRLPATDSRATLKPHPSATSEGRAAASGAPEDELVRWVPAFSVDSGAMIQKGLGVAMSGPVAGTDPADCAPPDFDGCLRPPAAGDDLMVTPFVVGNAELMTPALTALPGSPRLFVHGGAGAAFSVTRDVAKEGAPEEAVRFPDVDAQQALRVNQANQLAGQGSKTSLEVKPLVVTAGAGVAFTLHAGERRIRIKPSAEYLREELEIGGLVTWAVAEIPTTPNCDFPVFPTTDPNTRFRCASVTGSATKAYHGVGPGLEVEMDTNRAGPFVLTVYIGARAYAFLGDLGLTATGSNELGETAVWSAEKNRWAFQGSLGLRFRWLPD